MKSSKRMNPLVEMRGISKRFGAVQALDQVDFEVFPGEVVGLVGDNGAGKSTLMKILAGVLPPDKGQIYWEGRPVQVRTPHEARALGIEMVYQDLALADNLDVVGNLFLGRELYRPLLDKLIGLLEQRRMEARAVEVLDRLQIRIPSLRQKVRYLSGGQRQAVAIGRTILAQAHLVILDEPTAALGVAEVEKVLALIRRLKDQGIAVIFITHRLPHIFAVADRIIVLRAGRRVGTRPAPETSIDEITKLIVGTEIEVTPEEGS